MWLQRLAIKLVRSPYQAALLILLLFIIPLVNVLFALSSTVIILLITLQRGLRTGALLAVWALALDIGQYLAIYQYKQLDLSLQWMAFSFSIIILSWLFLLAMASMVRMRIVLSDILQRLALFSLLIISTLHLIYPTVSDKVASLITDTMGHLFTQYQQATQTKSTVEEALIKSKSPHATSAYRSPHQVIQRPSHDKILSQEGVPIREIQDYLLGYISVWLLIMSVFYVLLARWWQAASFPDIPPLREECYHIRLSRLAGVFFTCMILAMVANLKNTVILDMFPVVIFLLVVAGLSVVHYGLRRVNPSSVSLRVFLYLLLAFSLPFSMIALAIIALIDSLIDSRQYLNRV